MPSEAAVGVSVAAPGTRQPRRIRLRIPTGATVTSGRIAAMVDHYLTVRDPASPPPTTAAADLRAALETLSRMPMHERNRAVREILLAALEGVLGRVLGGRGRHGGRVVGDCGGVGQPRGGHRTGPGARASHSGEEPVEHRRHAASGDYQVEDPSDRVEQYCRRQPRNVVNAIQEAGARSPEPLIGPRRSGAWSRT